MQALSTLRPTFILDTSPLSVLCRFPLEGIPYIHGILSYADLVMPEGVINETRGGTGVIARVVLPLLKSNRLRSMRASTEPAILDTAYGKLLGTGERDVIRLALANQITPVIDDKDAFVIACRFGLRPIGFHDFIVRLVSECGLSADSAIEIVNETARQYPISYLPHTLDLLIGYKDANSGTRPSGI